MPPGCTKSQPTFTQLAWYRAKRIFKETQCNRKVQTEQSQRSRYTTQSETKEGAEECVAKQAKHKRRNTRQRLSRKMNRTHQRALTGILHQVDSSRQRNRDQKDF